MNNAFRGHTSELLRSCEDQRWGTSRVDDPLRPGLVPQARPERLALSYAQQRLWFIDQLEGTSAEYNVPEALRLRGRLDQDALERTVNVIVERHEILRTHFAEVEGGEPVQRILPSLRIDVPVQDLRALDEASRQEAVAAALRRQWEPFDLARGPAMRITLLKLGDQEHILLQTFHRIVFDEWSAGVFNREFEVLYEAFHQGRENPLKPLPIQYADFALWQRNWVDGEALNRGLGYWKQQLAGIPERLALPTDKARQAVQTYAAELCKLNLPPERVATLRRLSQDNQATLYMTLLSAFAVLLGRYSGQEDIVVGSPIANRQEANFEHLIGFFANSLPMRVRVRPLESFSELLSAVRRTTLDAYHHQDIPFERLVEELSPERSSSHPPVFQVTLALRNEKTEAHHLQGLEVEPLAISEFRVRFDLEVHAIEHDGGLDLCFLYKRDLFDRWRVEQMTRHYVTLLESALATPDVPLCCLDIFADEERHMLLEGFNATACPFPEATLPQLFEAQVVRDPEATALVFGEESLSYQELNARANRLAHHLIGLGVGPESLVAIAIERSIETVVALLGVLKAGGAYLPLDPDYPQVRLAQMLKDAAPTLVLSTSALCGRMPQMVDVVSLDASGVKHALSQAPPHNPKHSDRSSPLLSHHPAYVIYTSGSTGRPKGVVVCHQALSNYLNWATEYYESTRGIGAPINTSIAFDATITSLYLPLIAGRQVILLSEDRQIEELAELIARGTELTLVKLTPSLLEALRGLFRASDSTRVSTRGFVVGGEALSAHVTAFWRRHAPNLRIINEYGPTEAVVGCCVYELQQGDVNGEVPIGSPTPNTRLYVLGGSLNLLPIGVIGELYIGGIQLARGYLNRPGLTAERFVADPHALDPGTRMYRTGDLARWRADGTLEFLGRADQQIKIRGFRVEPGEIEAALTSHERVQEALVILNEERDEKQLLAYVITRQDEVERGRAEVSHIIEWQELYDSTYSRVSLASNDFDTAGWNSSYTGEPIPAEEMRLWVEETVAKVRTLSPSRVLEIGCGTGLLLTRLAASCESYVGLDFSSQALAQLKTYLALREDLSRVQLRQGLAHELSFVTDDAMDLVILNSVVQYFPNMDYLLEVLSEAVRVTRRGGHIFVGDLRSLPLLEAFHTSVQLHKAPKERTLGDLRRSIRQAQWNERELVIDPALFEELGRRWSKVGRIEVCPKPGSYDNELTRFRYDVTMRLGEKESIAEPERWLSWDKAGKWRGKLEEALARAPGLTVGVRGIRDKRVAAAVEAVLLLQGHESTFSDAGQLRARSLDLSGEDPDVVMQWTRGLGVTLCWQSFGRDGVYDALFNPRWRGVESFTETPRSYYRKYANVPARSVGDAELGMILKKFLQRSLPDYMIPSAIIALPSWPLTPNGKVDRMALPGLQRCSEGYRAPRTPTEEVLCGLFAEVLSLERVGIEDNFFALGGHSLLATRLAGRVRSTLGVELAIRTLFEAPTVAELAMRVHAGEPPCPALVPQPRPERLPLSYAQQRLWFFHRLEGPSATYNIPIARHLEGHLDSAALEAALADVVGRHESLRTIFSEAEGVPFQEILSAEQARPVVMSEVVVKAALASRLTELACTRIELSQEIPLRVWLLQLEPQHHVLLLLLHHIAGDDWSIGPLSRDLSQAYTARKCGEAPAFARLAVQYADYTLWQRQLLGEESDCDSVLARQLGFWRKALAGAPEELNLPSDHPRPPVISYRGSTLRIRLDAGLHRRLRELAQASGASLFMVLHAGLAALLSRLGAGEDILIGSPIAGRREQALENLVGFFVNTLVLRTDVSGDPSFSELLTRVRSFDLEAYEHQEVPFEQVVEALKPARSPARNPLFQVMLMLQNAPDTELALPDLAVRPEAVMLNVTKFDLTIGLGERLGPEGQPLGIEGGLEYRVDLFEQGTIEAMAAHLVRLLEAAVTSPDVPLQRLDIFGPGERQMLLERFNATARPLPETTLPELFEVQVARSPEATAIIFGEASLTYRDLNLRANRLAHHLIGLGVRPESLVGIALDRSIEMVVALLATLKAGGAYLPLDPNYPRSHLAHMLTDAAPILVLTTTALSRRLPQGVKTIRLDAMELQAALDEVPVHNVADEQRSSPLLPRHPAYVIYTSGSTGKPKGVIIEHQSIVTFALWAGGTFSEKDWSGVLASTSICFDLSVFELLVTLAHSGTVILAESLLALPTLPAKDKVRLINTVPSAASWLVDSYCVPAGVRTINLAGETLRNTLVQDLYRYGQVKVVNNLYGPSEDTTYSTFALCARGASEEPTIGSPIWNTRVYVLDAWLELSPIGVTGELYVAGAGLARGYLNRPGLTAERFVADPHALDPGTRMYRTGDLARWRADGTLEFLGRADQQIKIRGFRIELGEIEAALSAQSAVAQAAVIAREDGPRGKQLLAYVVAAPGKVLEAAALRRELGMQLPDHMVPSIFVILNALPLTPNGKVNRAALPEPVAALPMGPKLYVAPRDSLELQLVKLWEKILEIRPIGVRDNFFELGGHSLLAVRLFAQVAKVTHKNLPLVTLFKAPTIEQLAKLLSQDGWTPPWSPLVPIKPTGSRLPFYCVHGVGGNIVEFAHLARYAEDEQPWYGIQAQGLDGKKPWLMRVEDMAALYTQEIRAFQPEGPYYLGGSSFGGLVAYEMAQQLHAQGERVALLALFDTNAPSYPRYLPTTTIFRRTFYWWRLRVELHWSNLKVTEPEHRLAYVLDKAYRLRRRIRNTIRHGYRRVRTIIQSFYLPRPIREVQRSGHEAMRTYLPKPYPGRITLFRATEQPYGIQPDPALGWGELATGDLEIIDVMGHHGALIREPRVRSLAQKLNDSLRKAQTTIAQSRKS